MAKIRWVEWIGIIIVLTATILFILRMLGVIGG